MNLVGEETLGDSAGTTARNLRLVSRILKSFNRYSSHENKKSKSSLRFSCLALNPILKLTITAGIRIINNVQIYGLGNRFKISQRIYFSTRLQAKIEISKKNRDTFQRAFGVKMTLYRRRSDVITSHRR